MNRPSIAVMLENEKKVSKLSHNVESLISIAKEHGEHLRELFSSTSGFVTKAELLAAMASANRGQI
jgi:hypothetical protein